MCYSHFNQFDINLVYTNNNKWLPNDPAFLYSCATLDFLYHYLKANSCITLKYVIKKFLWHYWIISNAFVILISLSFNVVSIHIKVVLSCTCLILKKKTNLVNSNSWKPENTFKCKLVLCVCLSFFTFSLFQCLDDFREKGAEHVSLSSQYRTSPLSSPI